MELLTITVKNTSKVLLKKRILGANRNCINVMMSRESQQEAAQLALSKESTALWSAAMQRLVSEKS